jgi:hypothetical protein
MKLTGITGALDEGRGEVSGRLGSGDLALGTSLGAFLDSALFWRLPGVEGYADRKRGVPFMACSGASLEVLFARCDPTRISPAFPK